MLMRSKKILELNFPLKQRFFYLCYGVRFDVNDNH